MSLLEGFIFLKKAKTWQLLVLSDQEFWLGGERTGTGTASAHTCVILGVPLLLLVPHVESGGSQKGEKWFFTYIDYSGMTAFFHCLQVPYQSIALARVLHFQTSKASHESLTVTP